MGFAMNDNIIRFPGNTKTASASATPAPEVPGADGLTDDQRKAIQLVASGLSFVMVALKSTDRGADFFTAVHGDATDLRNAQGHLDGVIARAFDRKGI